MEFRFGRSSRKHRIGRAHALAALENAGVPEVWTAQRDGVEHTYLKWIGDDDRDIELEIVGRIAMENPDLVIIIHVMPTMLRDL